jgi:hypothetical protein
MSVFRVQGRAVVFVEFDFEDDGENDITDQAFELLEESVHVSGHDADVYIDSWEIDEMYEVAK